MKSPNPIGVIIGFCFIAFSTQQFVPHGTEQIFSIQDYVVSTDLKHVDSKSSGYSLDSALSISSVWHSDTTQVLLFELKGPKLSVLEKGPANKAIVNLEKATFYLALEDGQITKFLTNSDTDTSHLNLKRGLGSLFQFQFGDGPFAEKDSLGQCTGFYRSRSSTKYEKTKTDCSNWDLKVNFRPEVALGVFQKSFQVIEYDLSQDGHLLKIASLETHTTALQAKPDVGSQIVSKLLLTHSSSHDAEQLKFKDLQGVVESLVEFKEFDLEADVDGQLGETNENLKDLIKANKVEFDDKNIGTESSALLLVKLLPVARVTKSQQFVEIFKSTTTKTSQMQLIDLLGATQTEAAHNAFFTVFDFEKEKNFDQIERYLQSLVVGTRPEKLIIDDLFRKVSEGKVLNDKLKDTLTQTVAALSSRYAKQSTKGFDDPLVRQTEKFILHQLEQCTNSECKEVNIRALQNLKSPTTIDIVIGFATGSDTKCSVAAMKAVQGFALENFTEHHRKQLEKIFYQISQKYDSSARTISLDILLSLKPTKDQLKGFLVYLNSNDKQFEVKTYLLQKLRMFSEKCPRFAALLRGALADLPLENNYDVIAQKGLTTVLHRQLSLAPAYNESLFSIQEIFNGVLKRGSVDLILKAGKEEMCTFKLGIYTSGLSSFVGGSEDSDDADDSPSTAGMEISLQGVQLRPLVFFNGQSELMGHVWSGTASDPTPAYQATTLMQDHEQYITLQNGATVYLRVAGARSIDLSGQIDFSLWNRNAHTEISQKSGMAVQVSLIFGFSCVRLGNEISLTNNPKINVLADVDFYSDIKLCVQLGRPETVFRYKSEKQLKLINEHYYSKKYSNIASYKLPGSTLALNQKNNEMCNKIFS